MSIAASFIVAKKENNPNVHQLTNAITKYYLARKKLNIDTYYSIAQPSKHYVSEKKSKAQRTTYSDSIYMKCPEQANLYIT